MISTVIKDLYKQNSLKILFLFSFVACFIVKVIIHIINFPMLFLTIII